MKTKVKIFILLSLITFTMLGCANKEQDFDQNEVKRQIIDEINQSNNHSEEIKIIGDVMFYIHKLKDEDFTLVYGDENANIWYTAAEELGLIGKPAIPYLIKNLQTKNDYERAVTLYALLLSSQHENVKSFTKGEYINVSLDFNVENHESYKKIALDWWEKYKHNWN